MGITPGMKDLAQEIISSYEERVKSIGGVKKEVQQAKKETWEWLKQVDADRQITRQQLLNDLAQNRKDREEDVKAMRADFQKDRFETRDALMKDLAQARKDREKDVQAMREEFLRIRIETSNEMKKDLAQARKEREEEAKAMRDDVQAMRNEFRRDLKKTKTTLFNDLAQNRKDREEDVKAMREDFRKDRFETRDALMKDLAQARKDREKDVQAMREEFLKIRTSTQEDLKEAALVWSELIKTMAAKKSGEKVIIKEKSEETLPPPETRKESVAVKSQVPTTKEEVPMAESIVEEGIMDLEDKVLSIINQHPNGISLVDIAEKLGVVPVVLGRSSRSLLEKGKIRKEEKLYYPVIGE